ncbi:hypothetical protein MAR_027952 [Mya arenaria]|uniref:Secreted protein n=1 Tax=Mya arenaria TaxID=6604 RepID=A0ABY7DC76_MYAAR|nr:hypothetical protein MAR_027952 [Mya arenaria]
MTSSKTLMLVVVLMSLTLTSAGRRACQMDGETKNCVDVVGRRGAESNTYKMYKIACRPRNTLSNGFFSNAHVGGCLSVSNVNVSWS